MTIHKLVPPPSRISNNATVNILCLAASLWLCCNTDPSRNTLVTPLHHTTTSFGPLAPATSAKGGPIGTGQSRPAQKEGTAEVPDHAGNSNDVQEGGREPANKAESKASHVAGTEPQASKTAGDASDAAAILSVKTEQSSPASTSSPAKADNSIAQKQDRESLLVMTVSDDGHVWQWDVPLHGFLPPPTPGPAATNLSKGPAPRPSPAAPPKPALLGLLHTLPHSVTTFSVCPVPVGAGWAGDLNQPSSQSGEGGDAVAVLAAVTSAGNVELITLQRGALTPLSSAISVSLGMPVSAHLGLTTACSLRMAMTRGSFSGVAGNLSIHESCTAKQSTHAYIVCQTCHACPAAHHVLLLSVALYCVVPVHKLYGERLPLGSTHHTINSVCKYLIVC